MSPAQYQIIFQPIGRRISIDAGADLLSAAQLAGVDLLAVCGGLGICGTCKVILVSGQLTPPTAAEEEALDSDQLARGYRLACQASPLSDVRLEVPPESLPAGQRLQVEGQSAGVELHPAVTALDVSVDEPGGDDFRSDLTRVLDAAGLSAGVDASPAALAQLSTVLRENDWQVRLAISRALSPAINEGARPRLAGAFAPGAPLLGLAVDMGSTKLAVYLLDLQTGALLGQTGLMNPQIVYGEDVVSRIAYANRSDKHRLQLQTRLIEAVNQAAAGLCGQAGLSTENIVDAVLVGNTAMHHFAAGLPVAQLGAAPYVPAVSTPLSFPAAGIGLKLTPGALAYLPANIAGYVGADHTAALLSSAMVDDTQTIVLVDIGTNTEISVLHQGRMLSCSTASGPAFEGAHIRDGMRAAPGAIDKVKITPDGVQISTIGGAAPAGICGTGILQAVAEMLEAGLINERGMLNRSDSRLRIAELRAEYVLAPAGISASGRDIGVTRKDVNEIQLAKGAIRSGIDILLKEAGVEVDQVGRWIIAGAFGTWLDLGSAVRIGMFPRVPLERFEQVGNAAGMGARRMLLDARTREEAARIAERAEYVELTVYPGFTDVFLGNMWFKGGEKK
ncbi:MAG: ASKHA domain-containing protein [Anaerolineaceae bacterium]